MAVLWTISLLHSYLLLLLLLRGGAPVPSRRRRPRPDDAGRGRPPCLPDYWGDVWAGAAVEALAREGYHVVLAGRSSEMLSETVQEIRSQQPDAYLEAFQVNLSSYRSIKKFETSLNQWIQDSNMEHSIQLLVNNAGMLEKSYRITEDDFDEMMQTNYIGPFVLTNTLLPLLKNSSTPSWGCRSWCSRDRPNAGASSMSFLVCTFCSVAPESLTTT